MIEWWERQICLVGLHPWEHPFPKSTSTAGVATQSRQRAFARLGCWLLNKASLGLFVANFAFRRTQSSSTARASTSSRRLWPSRHSLRRHMRIFKGPVSHIVRKTAPLDGAQSVCLWEEDSPGLRLFPVTTVRLREIICLCIDRLCNSLRRLLVFWPRFCRNPCEQ
jgi:hypothetical protein